MVTSVFLNFKIVANFTMKNLCEGTDVICAPHCTTATNWKFYAFNDNPDSLIEQYIKKILPARSSSEAQIS